MSASTSVLNQIGDIDRELLVAAEVLLYDASTTSMFARVAGAAELAKLLPALESDDSRAAFMERLCEEGVVWQVLHEVAVAENPDALYDDIAEELVTYPWGDQVIEHAVRWAVENRHHNTWEWLLPAVKRVKDPVALTTMVGISSRLATPALERLLELDDRNAVFEVFVRGLAWGDWEPRVRGYLGLENQAHSEIVASLDDETLVRLINEQCSMWASTSLQLEMDQRGLAAH